MRTFSNSIGYLRQTTAKKLLVDLCQLARHRHGAFPEDLRRIRESCGYPARRLQKDKRSGLILQPSQCRLPG